jgi:5-methyltetrahydropteroyltriglutamate--homocysteine methyltransferase
MRRSGDRILTTHAGSLPRPDDLAQTMLRRQAGEQVDEARLAECVCEAVGEVVRRQAAAGIDVVSDGEMGKPGFINYVPERLTGFGGESPFPPMADLADFPEYAAELYKRRGARIRYPRCEGPVGVASLAGLERDIANLRAALSRVEVEDAFVPAASPGVIVQDFDNVYYDSREEYLDAVAAAMAVEYRAIIDAGFLLQVDAPDLAMSRHVHYRDAPIQEFRAAIRQHVDALNRALEGIPADRVRLHVCWGNYPGPHHHDVPLREIVDVVLAVHARAIYVEAANPRHQHEWAVFEEARLPEEKTLIIGCIDTVTNHIEHPELVAQRIERYARLVGRERVIAATDCGFGTFVGVGAVHPTIAWAKLEALAEGARVASQRLW